MKPVHRGVAVAAALIAGLITAATSTAAPSVASSARATGQAATSCSNVATIPVGPAGNIPTGIAVNSRSSKIYVASINPSVIGSGQVEVINGKTNTVVATVPVGDSAAGVAVNPRTNTVYVANAKNRTVSVRRQVGVAVPGKQREAQQHPAHRGAHPSPLRGSAAGQPRRPS